MICPPDIQAGVWSPANTLLFLLEERQQVQEVRNHLRAGKHPNTVAILKERDTKFSTKKPIDKLHREVRPGKCT